MADPAAPAQKRLRLDSVNPVHNGHTFPPPPLPPHTRPHSHPTPVQAPSPVSRHYPAHSLPPPSQPYPSPVQGSYPGHQPSPSLPPSDIRAFADPRNIPSPGQRPHGVPGPSPVTAGVPQDSISTYRPPPTPQSSTAPEAVDVKPPPGMEHGSHPSPWSVNQDHRNGSVSSGYNPTMSPPHPNDQAYHPPPPGQPYGQPVPYGAPSPYLGQYSGQQAQVRRKQVRATQACNHCRARKQKCDEARPCQFCRENNFDCQYKDVPPPKQDRSMMQLQDSVNSMTDVLTNFIGEFSAWRHDVESRLPPRRAFENTSNVASPETAIVAPPRESSTSRMPTPLQGKNGPLRLSSMNMKTESPIVPYSASPGRAQASTPIKQESLLLGTQQPATPADSVKTDMSRATDAGAQDKAGLQSDHTTPAHKLLEDWPAMQNWWRGSAFLQKLKNQNRPLSDYPMQLEQERGLLRPWGYGEGLDLNDGAQGPGSPESSNESDVSSPAPGKEGLWGHPPSDKPSPRPMNGSIPEEDHPGGLGSDGRPDFRVATMDTLLESYERNMHNLHPFLNRSKIQKMFREFKDQYSPDARPSNTMSPAAHHVSVGMKRKRSSSAFGEPYQPKGAIERSLRNAIVLLILALGKVCSYKKRQPLPSPKSDRNPHARGTWGAGPGTVNGSFGSDTSEDRERNIDIMPGMAYYSYATDILGNHHGGLTIAHAQAFILAALYISQFARVLESWSWINSACRITIVLLKADLDKLRREWYLSGEANNVLTPKERYKLDLVLFVYWTCLQLESDIVAEMSTLPTSSVTTYQSFIMYPAGVCESFPIDGMSMVVPEPKARPNEDIELMIYSSQIYLRVIMNEAHNQLYGSKSRTFDENDPKAVAVHVNYHMEVLSSWRKMLLGQLQWNDNDPPSTDRNHARLRAKYYGGLYMMLRPYLRLAVMVREWPPSHQSSRQRAPWSHQSSPASMSTNMNRGVQMVDLSNDQREMINLASVCIEAAIRSTIAFDRIGAPEGSHYEGYRSTRTERLVLTNIFGTMHAQFGNMLVLAAVYKSPMYKHLPENSPLTPRNLDALFERTIVAIQENAPNSPILKVDLEVLHHLRSELNLPRSSQA